MEAKTWDEVGKLQQKWRGMEDMRYVLLSILSSR